MSRIVKLPWYVSLTSRACSKEFTSAAYIILGQYSEVDQQAAVEYCPDIIWTTGGNVSNNWLQKKIFAESSLTQKRTTKNYVCSIPCSCGKKNTKMKTIVEMYIMITLHPRKKKELGLCFVAKADIWILSCQDLVIKPHFLRAFSSEWQIPIYLMLLSRCFTSTYLILESSSGDKQVREIMFM